MYRKEEWSIGQGSDITGFLNIRPSNEHSDSQQKSLTPPPRPQPYYGMIDKQKLYIFKAYHVMF